MDKPLIQQQDAVEVFVNQDGGITIKQSGFGEDSIVYINAQHVELFAMEVTVIANDIANGAYEADDEVNEP